MSHFFTTLSWQLNSMQQNKNIKKAYSTSTAKPVITLEIEISNLIHVPEAIHYEPWHQCYLPKLTMDFNMWDLMFSMW
jgi:hypothetical protein